MKRWHTLAAAAPVMLCAAWLNPTHDRIAAANRLFKSGKFNDAVRAYGDVLVNDPDSALLNFNMGDANYKAGKYAEALAAYARVSANDKDAKLEAATAYNAGNAEYRLGAAAEATKPDDALKAYALALAAYRRAIGADPHERDAKFNYEFVSKKVDALKKKLEQQKEQQQKQQQQQQQSQSQQQNQPPSPTPGAQQQAQPSPQAGSTPQAQQQADHQQTGGPPTPSPQPTPAAQQEQAAQSAQAAQQQHGAGQAGEAQAAARRKDQMSAQEATALIDSARNDELQPQEFLRQGQHGRVAEPTQDW